MIKRFISYYRPHLGLLFLDLFCALSISAADLTFPMLTRHVINTIIPMKQLAILVRFGALMLGLYALRMIFEYIVGYWGHVLGVRFQYDLRRQLYGHLQTLSFTYYDNNKTGHIMARIITDLFELSEIAHHAPEDLLLSIIKVIGAFILLLTINVPLTLITFAVIPFVFAYMLYFNGKFEKAFRAYKERTADINARIEESIAGIRVVKSFTNEGFENERFDRNNTDLKDARTGAVKYIGIFDSTVNFASNIALVVNIVAGGFFVATGRINVGDFVAFMLFIGQFLQPLNILLRFVEQYQEGAAGFRRFIEILDTKPDIVDAPDAIELGGVKGDIRFVDVGFNYEAGKKVLHRINLHVEAGETVAIVGPSGSGKTTLCSILPRFYDISEGKILLDGIDHDRIKLESLRRSIGVVQQDVFLFSGTIRENILYGRLDATDDEVVAAAKAANAHEFIELLPKGYETYIGERGVKLSGGQKQRVSIARMFLKNPPVLILDEATSSLDNRSEVIIQQSIERLARDRTTFIIAHRLATIRNAKRIIVLTERGIVEEGSHEALMANRGVYWSLYNAQTESLIAGVVEGNGEEGEEGA